METFDLFLQNVVFRGFYEFYHKVDVVKYFTTRKGGWKDQRISWKLNFKFNTPWGIKYKPTCEHPILNSVVMDTMVLPFHWQV